MKLHLRASVAALFTTVLLAGPATAQQTIRLTMAASHPATIPWINLMSTYFKPEVDKRLAASGKFKIEWNEAYGGQLYKFNATLSAVQDGITDIGWVGTVFESSKMQLANVTYNAPFATDNALVLAEIFNELNDTMPALKKEWDDHNAVFLAATVVDTHNLFTKTPTVKFEDLKGKKISSPGVAAVFLRGTGAVAVDGALTSWYTDIQSGVTDGVVTIPSGFFPAKLYEVAPHISRLSIGAMFTGGLAINKDSWAKLPPEVKTALREVGREYSKQLGALVNKRSEEAISAMLERGAKLAPWPAEERAKWVSSMPNVARDWARAAEGRGKPGTAVLAAYMDALRNRGETPARNWDKDQ